jgi:hypothetical protein
MFEHKTGLVLLGQYLEILVGLVGRAPFSPPAGHLDDLDKVL